MFFAHKERRLSFHFMKSLSFIWCCWLCVSYFTITETSAETHMDPSALSVRTFMYFAYGSNLLAKRIHIQNPTAVRRNIGKLKNYRLDFLTSSMSWNGASATIVKHNGSDVWGAIWEIDISNMEDLDRQEGVERNLYKVLSEIIETPTGEQITCRSYQQTSDPTDVVKFEDIPVHRQPSKTYLSVILQGAEESKLPVEYINKLKKIPHNSNDASSTILKQLGWD